MVERGWMGSCQCEISELQHPSRAACTAHGVSEVRVGSVWVPSTLGRQPAPWLCLTVSLRWDEEIQVLPQIPAQAVTLRRVLAV